MPNRVANFYAGPATLPLAVLEEAQKEFLDYNNSGMSIIETSHRSPEFSGVIQEAEAGIRELMSIPEEYAVLFLQGGASINFALLPMNLGGPDKVNCYVNTGAWSKKAIKEGKIQGSAEVLASSEDKNFSYIPDFSGMKVPENASFLHITSNNTIFGTEFHAFPETGSVPLVADMSSDIMSRPIDVKKFGVIYAGAQKNIGPSGIALVIIRKDLLDEEKNFPTFFNYATHAKNGSLFNTPNSFGVYLISKVVRNLKDKGGLEAVSEHNKKKAELLYKVIDESSLFKGTADKASRSLMNVTFIIESDELVKKFLDEAKGKGLIGLKGHRSVGGFRASIYNSQPMENVEKLCGFMKEFETAVK